MSDDLDDARLEILRLRARVVVLERAVLASLELMLRIRPEELSRNVEIARSRLEENYLDTDFAPDVVDATEREFLSREVDGLMRGLQAEMGFPGGVIAPENG